MGQPPSPPSWKPPADRLPEPYQHYELLEPIGGGGMGLVYMARSERSDGISQAIKFLKHADWEKLAPFFREEARLGRRIVSDYVAHVDEFLDLHESVAEGWLPAAIVMPLYQLSLGQLFNDLRDKKVRLSCDLAALLARHTALGVKKLHDRGLVHRDIKPQNVFLEIADGRVYYPEQIADSLAGVQARVGDLGVVCRADEVPVLRLGPDRGPRSYKAPELFDDAGNSRRDRPANRSEDIWSLGMLLEDLAELVEGPATWLRGAARACLEREPARRPTIAELLLLLSPDWELQEKVIREQGGWNPEAHPNFVGRDFVFESFEQYRASRQDRGGIFLIEGEAGVGKTALLANWIARSGPHPAFFFRYQEGRTRVSAMPEALLAALCHRFDYPLETPDKQDQLAERLKALLERISREKLTPDGLTLLLFVDGLDESDKPEQAVHMLPKQLPRGVFLIVSSRPPARDKDHLAPLVSGGACRFALHGEDSRNLDNVAAYFRQQLEGRLHNGQARALAEGAGGIFQLAVYLVEAIREDKLTVEQALTALRGLAELPIGERIHAWYRESWQRITADLSREDTTRLVDFLTLMAALQAPIAEPQVLGVLQWALSDLDWARRQTSWLLRRQVQEVEGYREANLRLRHQSVHDFLVSVDYEGPARYGMESMHARVARHFQDEASRSGSWIHVAPYGRFHTVRHLIKAATRAHLQQAATLLTDLDYLQGTLGDEPPHSY